MPKITIISGCYNNSQFIELAVSSVFNQTFRDFEILIINDASTDSSYEKLKELSKRDSRLKILNNSHNLGLARTLNLAIDQSDSEYIARFDTDDIMHHQRLEKQLSFIENKKIELLGTYIKTIGQGRSKIISYPQSDSAIRFRLLFQSPFAHPSVIYKRAALGVLRYDSKFAKAEDYALWIELSKTVKMYNMPETLLYYRLHQNQTSVNKVQQNQDAALLRLKALAHHNINISIEDQKIHSKLRYTEPYSSYSELISAELWLLKLAQYFNYDEAHHQLAYEWFLCCIRATHFGKLTWQRYKSSALLNKSQPTRIQESQLYFLCFSKTTYQSKFYKALSYF